MRVPLHKIGNEKEYQKSQPERKGIQIEKLEIQEFQSNHSQKIVEHFSRGVWEENEHD